jgi:hypothetical protein
MRSLIVFAIVSSVGAVGCAAAESLVISADKIAGDPAEDIKNFAHVRCVFRGGDLIYSATGGK